MNTFTIRPHFLASALVAAIALTACGGGSGADASSAASGSSPKQQADTALGRFVATATDEARKELVTQNIDLQATGHPKGEITPKGDLLIGGKPVQVDANQRKLLLEYRQGIIAVADAGMVVGTQGADLAGKAVSEAISGIFSGEPERIEQRIEAEAKKIEASALQLCERLPALKDAQDRLAKALPEFEPYAQMDLQDIENCRHDVGDTVVDQQKLQNEIREDIRTAVRTAVQTAVDGSTTNAAEEAEAAGASEQQR